MSLLETLSCMLSNAAIVFNVNFTVAFTTILFTIFYWYLSGPKNIPPGPLGLPILGYLPFLGSKPHVTFNNLAKKYGPIFSLYLGNRLVIVLNSYEVIKEAFVGQAEIFAGRPKAHLTLAEVDKYSIPIADGEPWKIHRRFALNLLRDLGVGKMSIEPQIMDEIQHFLNELPKFKGEPTDFSELITASVSNNVNILIFGKRFEYDDPWFIESKRLITEFATIASSVSIFHFFPWLTKLPGLSRLARQEHLIQMQNKFKTSIYTEARERKMKYIDTQRDNYINAFLGEQIARMKKDENDSTFSDKAMEQNVRGLMVGGTETTSNTLMWGILFMILNPKVQQQVQKEIDEIIGKDRTPSYNDRLRTRYTEATLLEVQRYASIVQINAPHRNTEECELFGYKIPKDTFILSSLWAVHFDAKLWKDPEMFQPERFLSSNGKLVNKEHLIPFSMGKRECPGLSLAKMEMYLYFTSMLQKFTFKSPEGTTPIMETRNGITVAPKHFNVIALARNIDARM